MNILTNLRKRARAAKGNLRPGFRIRADCVDAARFPVELSVNGKRIGRLPLDVIIFEPPNELIFRYVENGITPPEGMVYVPGGEFFQGSDDDNFDETPLRRVFLDPFFIDKTPVTVREYAKLVHSTGYPPPKNWKGYNVPDDMWELPVTFISWFDARQFAEWAGKALPTEAQWEKAARGVDGRVYPWGDEWDGRLVIGWAPERRGVAPVGSIPEGASPFGALDMAGNVWEWVADDYDARFYDRAPVNHPLCDKPVNAKVLKGGSWADAGKDRFRTAFRYDSWHSFSHYDNVGFRTAKPIFPKARITLEIAPTKAAKKPGAYFYVNGEKKFVPLLKLEELTTGIYNINYTIEKSPIIITTRKPSIFKLSEFDGVQSAEMATVPAGAFIMGSDDEPQSISLPDHDCDKIYYEDIKHIWAQHPPDFKPRHIVILKPYMIDITPVTNRAYLEFVKAIEERGHIWCHPDEPKGKSHRPHYLPDAKWNKDNYPVVGVDWWDAYAYARFAGKRLPTEAEWEKAARGTDGRVFPWGNDWIAGGGNVMSQAELRLRGIDGRAWVWSFHDFRSSPEVLSDCGDGYENIAPVGMFPAGASPYGVLDMAGNVFEWVNDWYSPDIYWDSNREDPQGAESGEFKVLRGGGCFFDERFAKTFYRHKDTPDKKEVAYYGFRCAKDVE
ncbi:MAG: hypothetical protein Kow0090_19790 [Myxococcota bacterium]